MSFFFLAHPVYKKLKLEVYIFKISLCNLCFYKSKRVFLMHGDKTLYSKVQQSPANCAIFTVVILCNSCKKENSIF